MSTIKKTTLDNGLRIITDYVPSVESAAVGIWTGVGTRDEELKDNGVAHMVEHMLFKGTEKRSASQIAKEIEFVGGSMNAYTSREMTSYHIHLLKDHTDLALDVLSDMYLNSTFPEEEIERERHVILQEIGMCNDTPDDVIFDLHFETAYPDQPFGAPILGKAERIASMERDTLVNYVDSHYHAGNTVISVSGNIDHDAFAEKAAELFSEIKATPQAKTISPASYAGGEMRMNRELEQSHFILGFKGFGRLSDDYYAAQTLSSILGSGMSSRLFQEVREKRGLVYSIFSYHSGYQDCGQFGIYAGTGPDKLGEIFPVICNEIQRISEDVSEDELARVKAQLKSSLLMGRESMMNRADMHAKHCLFRGDVLDVETLKDRINSVNLNDIKRVATVMFAGKPTLSALGPLDELESYEQIHARLAA